MTEESKRDVPTSPEQAFEQASQRAREFGDQMAGQAREFSERAGEQISGFSEQAAEQASKLQEQAGQMRELGEKAIEQARAFNEQILESSRKVGQEALQHYVDWLHSFAEEQRRLASSPQVTEMDWFASMLKAQADFTRDFAKMVGRSPLGRSDS